MYHLVIIEINSRLSPSLVLASKTTGLFIARISGKLAVVIHLIN
ncbi:MAG: ATP-binding protein [Arsenophonus sp. NC-TX2-MAG3]